METVNRSVLRGQVTKIVKSAAEYLNAPVSQIKEQNAAEFDAIVGIVQATVKAEDFAKECEGIADYTDKAVSVLTRLKQRLAKLKERQANAEGNPTSNETQHTTSIKLPKLDLLKFSGDFKEWLPFWEQYRTSIHENSALSDTEKFNYLKALLTGKAAESIAGFTPTQACYAAAIALLTEEYGNTEKIIDKNVQQLISLSPISSRLDIIGLRRLYNTVMCSTRSLTALNVPSSHYYIMLKSVLLKCMPHDLRVEFYRHQETHSENKSPKVLNDNESEISLSGISAGLGGDTTVKGILRFLKKEVESLEKAGPSKKLPSLSSQKVHYTTAGLLTPMKLECCFCKSTTHTTQRCNSSQTVAQKKELLKRDGRCFRCTRKGHSSKNCPNQRNIRCYKCNKNHATSVCEFRAMNEKEAKTKATTSEAESTTQLTANLCSAAMQQSSKVYLQTACVLASATTDENQRSLFIRIILDGGSQRSYVRQEIARKLRLKVVDTVEMRILPFGSKKKVPARLFDRVRIVLKSQYDNRFVSFLAIIVPEICVDVLSAPSTESPVFANYALADDPRLDELEDGINVLIGADIYWSVVLQNSVHLTKNLVAIETLFGWTIQGPAVEVVCEDSSGSAVTAVALHSCAFADSNCERFWNLETLGISSDNNEISYSDFNDYIKRNEQRYECSLLWKNFDPVIDNYKSGAFRRFERLILKLSKDPDRLLEYDREMWEFISSEVAERVSENFDATNPTYYMPHRPVYRNDKTTTRLRIVFDASARTGENLSLNEHLHKGPNLLPDVLAVLLNFRLGRIALAADIEKAFLQLSLAEKDRNTHCFFWFDRRIDNPSHLPKVVVYRMTRVTFGVACSPFLLCATLKKHFSSESENYPQTCELLAKSFYMDDLVLSIENFDFAFQFYKETCQIIQRASMNIRKWNSNYLRLCAEFEKTNKPVYSQRVLGLIWNRLSDEVLVDLERTHETTSATPTKRNILQLLARIYDPLGIFGPFTVKLKILFQETWRLSVAWDDAIPPNLQTVWNQCYSQLEILTELTLPRYVFKLTASRVSQQLHIFCDSSLYAYGTVAYVRSQYKDGSVHVAYLCSKNRVAPLKSNTSSDLTLPKLELTAALIAARLSRYLKQHLNLCFESIHLWSDSKIALYWIKNDKRKYQPYVAHRAREIRQLTMTTDWYHCPGEDNPADLLTRGVSGKNLINSTIWLSGPQWLSSPADNWPKSDIIMSESNVLLCLQVTVKGNEIVPITPLFKIENFSSYKRILRVTAYVQRFVEYLKKHKLQQGHLTAKELSCAEIFWIKHIQSGEYKDEINALRNSKEIPRCSSILTLNPIMDEDGLLRVGSRLGKSDFSYNESFPIIFPKSSHLTKLLIKDAHERSLHSGVNITITRLRKKFWIVKTRAAVKAIVKSCTICQRYRGKPASQPFAPLPRDRLTASKPFETTGLDFAGPLYVRYTEEDATKKVYIMLLTCAVVRAVHLELVAALDTESCLAALRRFFARRGIPRTIISDNARTFKRASLELQQLGSIIYSEELQGYASNRGISWKFIVERAPWWGGFWERLVKSVKDILKITIGKAILNFDQLYTFLAEAEQIVNDRPLTYISDDPLDLSPLTPAHFLISSYPSSIASGSHLISDDQIRAKWKARLKISSSFFRRFKAEYIQRLRSAHHTHHRFSSNVKTGDVVIVHDQSAPRHLWKLARIETVFPDVMAKFVLVRCVFTMVPRCEDRFNFYIRLRSTTHRRPEDVKNC